MTRQVRKVSRKEARMPFVWNIAYRCLNLQDGTIRHFPAGTYNEQVATSWDRMELELIETVYRAWRAFIQLSIIEWGPVERRLAKWLMPEKIVAKPTRRLDSLVARLWRPGWWLIEVMRSIARD